MNITINVLRGEELRAALRVAPAAVRRHLAASIEAVARDVVEHARASHRFKTRSGTLERFTEAKVDRANLRAEVGFKASDVPYGAYVHDGTPPHKIRPKDRRALRWVAGGDFVFAKGVNHPGTAPDPFLYNAADRVDADAIFGKGVDAAIKEVFG